MVMTDLELGRRIRDMDWTFAKTYAAFAPHWYFIKDKDPQLFAEIERRVVVEGVNEKFYSKTFRYFYFDKWKFWICSPACNRVPVDPEDFVGGATD